MHCLFSNSFEERDLFTTPDDLLRFPPTMCCLARLRTDINLYITIYSTLLLVKSHAYQTQTRLKLKNDIEGLEKVITG